MGTALAFIPISIAGLAGVQEREAGLASGLLNTSQQLGGAIGVAIASTAASTHLNALLSKAIPPQSRSREDSSGPSGSAGRSPFSPFRPPP